jgi:hypothetical protein
VARRRFAEVGFNIVRSMLVVSPIQEALAQQEGGGRVFIYHSHVSTEPKTAWLQRGGATYRLLGLYPVLDLLVLLLQTTRLPPAR